MPYSPPVTFTNATVLAAADLNSNILAVDKYLSLGINAAAEIEDDAIVSDRILRPAIKLISDGVVSTYFQTGSIHHIRLEALDYDAKSDMVLVPYQSSGFISGHYSKKADTWLPVNGTWISFYAIEAPSCIIIRYVGDVFVPDDHTNTGRQNAIACQYEKTVALESISRIPTCITTTQDRRPVSGCAIYTSGLTAGWHSIGLVAGFSTNYGLIGGMEISVEVLY